MEKNINNLQIGEQTDWKFGIITRTIVRIDDNRYEIHNTSSGWVSAVVNRKTVDMLLSGEKSLFDLKWK